MCISLREHHEESETFTDFPFCVFRMIQEIWDDEKQGTFSNSVILHNWKHMCPQEEEHQENSETFIKCCFIVFEKPQENIEQKWQVKVYRNVIFDWLRLHVSAQWRGSRKI